jgi:hypothetical protein
MATASGVSGHIAAGGGGGGYTYMNYQNGGLGGGGKGANRSGGSSAATVNTGSGGGGGTDSGGPFSTEGASGLLLVRYPSNYNVAASTTGSPVIYVAGGYRYYKFTGAGSITF